MDLSINPQQILVLFCVFIASTFVLNYFVFQPTLIILKEREKRIAGASAEAGGMAAAAQDKLSAYEKLMQQARQAARAAREDILRSAEEEKNRVLAEARRAADTVMAAAKSQLQADVEMARRALKRQAGEIAALIAEKILQRKAA